LTPAPVQVAVRTRAQATYRADQIRVTDRVRGVVDTTIDTLITSIQEIGLLYPILITRDGVLVDGLQRLTAMRRLGIEDIPVQFDDSDDSDHAALIRRELAANGVRTQWTPVQAAAARRRLRELTDRAPQRRDGSALKDRRKGWAAELATAETGVSRTTMDRVDQITRIAEDETAPTDVRLLAAEGLEAVDRGDARVGSVLANVQTAKDAADCVARYPELAALPNHTAIIRMARVLDEMTDTERDQQLATLRAAWSDASHLVSHHVFAEDEARNVSNAISGTSARRVVDVLSALTAEGKITPSLRDTWTAHAESMARYADAIRAALNTDPTEQR